MKALVYEKAHSLEDFAIKLAEIRNRPFASSMCWLTFTQLGSTQAKLSFAGRAVRNLVVASCLVGNLPAWSSRWVPVFEGSKLAIGSSALETCRETVPGLSVWRWTIGFLPRFPKASHSLMPRLFQLARSLLGRRCSGIKIHYRLGVERVLIIGGAGAVPALSPHNS